MHGSVHKSAGVGIFQLRTLSLLTKGVYGRVECTPGKDCLG